MEKPDKKTSILTVSETLFSELGYEGTSTRQIAKEACVNMAMINYYFGSKEGVFLEIMNQRLTGFRAQLISISEEPISHMEKLVRVIDSYSRRVLCNVSFHRMMHRELSLAQRPEIWEKLKVAMNENLIVIDKIISEGIADGTFRKVDVRMLIATIMGTISYVVTSPSKLTPDSSLDITNPKDKEILTKRLSVHLQDLVKTYLTPNK
jgi:AcrR family transcriptional regulator